MNRRRPTLVVTVLVAIAVTSSCAAASSSLDSVGSAVTPSTTPSARSAASRQDAPASTAVDKSRKLLASLRPIARTSPKTLGYVRSAFGSGWIDTDHNGCNQRDDVLLRDAVPGTAKVGRQGRCDHDVLAGTWIDPYTSKRLTFTDLKDRHQAQGVQIDHVVPLAEAWVSGANRWSVEKRHSFANDLSELLAVDGPTNASKGDGDPAAWRPRKAYQCRYARRWIGVKATWGLGVDQSERNALSQMLGFCAS